jgi:hypothetical protein
MYMYVCIRICIYIYTHIYVHNRGVGLWDSQPKAQINGQECMKTVWVDNETVVCTTGQNTRIALENPEVTCRLYIYIYSICAYIAYPHNLHVCMCVCAFMHVRNIYTYIYIYIYIVLSCFDDYSKYARQPVESSGTYMYVSLTLALINRHIFIHIYVCVYIVICMYLWLWV